MIFHTQALKVLKCSTYSNSLCFNFQYFMQLPISLGIDYTFEFGWIKDDQGNITSREVLYSNGTASSNKITSSN